MFDNDFFIFGDCSEIEGLIPSLKLFQVYQKESSLVWLNCDANYFGAFLEEMPEYPTLFHVEHLRLYRKEVNRKYDYR